MMNSPSALLAMTVERIVGIAAEAKKAPVGAPKKEPVWKVHEDDAAPDVCGRP